VVHDQAGYPLGQPLHEDPAVADRRVGLQAHEDGAGRTRLQQLGGQGVEGLGRALLLLDVLLHARVTRGDPALLVFHADVGGGAQVAAVLVGDPVLAEQQAELRLRHPRATGLRAEADVDQALHPRVHELGDEHVGQEPLVADGPDLGGHGAMIPPQP
jgi:hypothetical protein